MAKVIEKENRDYQLHFRCTKKQAKDIQTNARKAEMTVTEYLLFCAADEEKSKLDSLSQKLDRLTNKMCTIEQEKNGSVCAVRVSDGFKLVLTHEQVGLYGVKNIKGLFDPKKYEKFYGVSVDEQADDDDKD